jgi:hypothetical protein
MLAELKRAWEQASSQLAELRSRVELTRELAETKIRGEGLQQALDRAYRRLGEVLFEEVQRGAFRVPASMTTLLEALQDVQAQIREQKEAVRALLDEGNEVAARRGPKVTISQKSDLANKGKKG